jgi:mono/diheme cytochrome c family protein
VLTIEATMNRIYLLIAILAAIPHALAGDPALPGHHPLTQIQAGSVLMAELRCSECHSGMEAIAVADKTAPELAQVGTRISPEYLRRFLASPLTVHPGTTMPDLLASRSESQRQTIAEALTHFLVSRSITVTPSEPTESIDRKLGKELYHSIGCVACHGPKEAISELQQSVHQKQEDPEGEQDESTTLDSTKVNSTKPIAMSLEHVGSKYNVRSLAEFLFEPLKVRSSGRMPDMKLTRTESLAIAGYLIGEQASTHEPLVPDTALIEAGKNYFQSLNCAACHALEGIAAARPVGPLKGADLTSGCLSVPDIKNANIRSPQFALEENQRAAIAAAIFGGTAVDSDNDALAKTLTAFRCVACHVRDDYGGVHEAHNAYFQGSEVNLGDDGRIPPPLTLMGAKLKPAWLKKVLFDGESVRNYMVTRMPQYGAKNLEHLPGIFRRLDVLDGPPMNIPNPEGRDEKEREQEKLMRAAGRELLGDKGANCVACHRFNSKAANVNQGIELLTSYERLEPQWFNRYLRNPGAFRPRTVMPSAWPDGVSAFQSILDGDSDRQIEAIWYYLSLGTSAADPSGVRAVSTKLEVGDQAVVHRGRSRVAGFRGIAVGLPEKISYAFNAETGTLSAIWKGNFIGVNWSGQGSGDFNPASEPITLAQDVSFVSLADENTPWPLLPVMTKEAPANPDPLYPKNLGYQFRGYYLGPAAIPTFQYRSGTIQIEDRTVAVGDAPNLGLKRVLEFQSPEPQTLWFRALVGDIRSQSDRIFQIGRLQLSIPAIPAKLRSLSDEPKRSELLLRLEIPQGKSTLELVYEPLK